MYSNLENKNIKEETNNLKFLLNELMQALNKNDVKMVQDLMNLKIIGEYNQWKNHIENEFR